MAFEPKLPDETVNLPKSHPVKEFVLLGVVFTLGLIGFIFGTSHVVDFAIGFVPPSLEQKIFQRMRLQSLGAPNEQLQKLTNALAMQWSENPYDFEVLVSKDKAINAVALPGGTVLVTQGLLDDIETENALAFVLAHEIGHFKNRDHLRGMSLAVATDVALALVGMSMSKLDFTELAEDLTHRALSRERERAADVFALGAVHSHYGHVANSLAFFEKVKKSALTPRVAKYFSTHPLSDDRIKSMQALAEKNGYATTGTTKPFAKEARDANKPVREKETEHPTHTGELRQ